jgi:DNA polymerase-1
VTLALIDGDLIAYRAALGSQETFDWGDTGGKVSVTDPSAAAQAAIKLVSEWADMVSAKDVIVALTGPDKFRKRLLPSYNSNRTGEKPLAHGAAVQSIKDTFPYHLINGLEGDDIMGILMTTDKYADRAVIVSIDKDMRTIPGRLFNPTKDRKPRVIKPAEADYWWMYQTLCGDTIDGYKGCPGIGDKKAMKALGGIGNPLSSMWREVVMTYRLKKLTEEDALVQARMARILRREDYDKATKEVILWHPTTPIRIPVEAAPSQEPEVSMS